MEATSRSDFDLLMDLLRGNLARTQKPEQHRLPPGRCSCHEPTVKWCTRHGEPQRYSSPMRTATATAHGANAAETTSSAPSSRS